ncbi:MAG: hypothetical protein CVV16_01245 [Gammaproteobacteria bacterium HGW-Gammaproteobacteria-6]|nr:MAG: hypothetical protein CVV16_01245 [Gammaproteobacteria bacterium HGW-Gammaproteobacteria-6]
MEKSRVIPHWRERWQLPVATAVGVILLLALFQLGMRLLGERMADNQLYQVLVNGQTLILDGKTLGSFQQDLLQMSAHQHRLIGRYAETWIDQWVDDSFARAEAAIPLYLDWYYSMPGSYSRLYHAIGGDLDDYLKQRLTGYLVDDSGLQQALVDFESDFNLAMSTEFASQSEHLARQLAGRYAQRQTEPSTSVLLPDLVVDIDSALVQGFTAGSEDVQRWQTSANASMLAGGGTLVWFARRTLIQRSMSLPAMQGARRVIAAYTARMMPRMAMAVSAGGSVAVATSPTGPGALVAGGVAFVTAAGTIVISDFALLKAEEAMLRTSLQHELSASLQASRETFRAKLHSHLPVRTSWSHEAMHAELLLALSEYQAGRRFHVLGDRSLPADESLDP